MSKPPLWKQIDDAWWSLVNTEDPHCCPPASDQAACVIRALRDWLKMQLPEGGAWYVLLTTEAERAEAGE